MFDLPAELALAILAYLPIHSVQSLGLVCRNWYKFIQLQESTIYHQSAMFHKLIPHTITSIEEAHVLYSSHSLAGVDSWKEFCKRRRYIERSWSGKASSNLKSFKAAGASVHRIKVDELAGYVLTTSCETGLTVTDIETDQVLWSLTEVQRHAHCEYGEGYLIFNAPDGSKEVWRRTDDYDLSQAEQRTPDSLPRLRQIWASEASASVFSDSSTRGHFQPWGLLRPAQPTRAFRFVYPILGAAAWDHVYLWDVRTGALVQTIEGTQRGVNGDLPFLGDMNYIEVGQKHVFLCGVHGLRGFSRETGRCILDLSSSDGPFGAWNFSIASNPPTDTTLGSVFIRQDTIRRAYHPSREIIDEFVAVHVSACGSHLAALLQSSKLVIMYDFERAARENIPIHNISLEVQLGSPRYSSRYLAFENGRVGIATRTGVFIVEPDFSEDITTLSPDTPPRLSVLRAPSLRSRTSLTSISCLQMTDTGLYFNWDPDPNPHDPDDPDDELFYSSVEDQPRYAVLVHGALFLLVDDLPGADPDPEASVVFCVDFTPTMEQVTPALIGEIGDDVE